MEYQVPGTRYQQALVLGTQKPIYWETQTPYFGNGGGFLENRTRAIQIKFWVDEEEKKIIDRKITKAKIGRGNYLREAAIKGEIFIEDLSNYSKLAKSVDAVGKNINQIARYVNHKKAVNVQELIEIKKRVGVIWQLLKSIR